jgi:signal transduction histidine kinase
VPRPRVHLEVAAGLRIADPERAHILLRCIQEIVTNAARHSDAENLWIVIERHGETFRIEAHDDGRGSDGARDGFGLRGMRERVERAGGELRIATQPGRGFDVTAMLPARGGAA